MTVYLVDFENVRSAGLKGVENLSEDDKVVIFYSKNADAITFDVHMLLSKSKAEIETYMILRGGRNSLDFQLSTYLGYLVMENRYRNIVIISADKGFLCAINFWDENKELCNSSIRMSKSIEAFESNEPDDDLENDNTDERFIEKISVIPSKNSDDEIKETVRLNAAETEEAKSKEKSAVNEPKQNDADKEPIVIELNRKRSERKGREKVKGSDIKTRNEQRDFISETDVSRNDKKKQEHTIKQSEKVTERPQTNAYPGDGEESKAEKKGTPQPQNPTSKNKIFAAEVKLNIADDVQEILGEKYGDKYVPMLVEAIGKSTGKQHLYRMLVSRLGQEVGKDIYMMIKGQYVNLKRK